MRQFPDIELPEPGARLQLGVFSELEGAERKQQTLAELGLDPWTRKRPTDEGVLYVVLLGPYDDEQNRRSAIATLDANNVEYFGIDPAAINWLPLREQ